MVRAAAIGALSIVAACASIGDPNGPTEQELARLIAPSGDLTPSIRAMRCDFISEEGSEWSCRYEARATSGVWVGLSAMVALDGDDWVLIDGICTPDEALADRGRCPR
ncbi:hypothetical protein ACETK8_01935 [Brevundimonas staleyi]|uniref:DUF333 domain-containing protein n=1 Tax=Brevundimonas staleyi TaxID=74326 RepID=A0ABW0FYD7_9CAUL